MFKRVVFMLVFLAFALVASAGQIVVHFGEDCSSADLLTVKVFSDAQTVSWTETRTGSFLPGESETFTPDLYAAYKVTAYAKNTYTGMSDNDEIISPSQYWVNDMYLCVPFGVKPPIGEPEDPD